MTDPALHALLILTVVLAVLLLIASTAMLGRKLADLEYQREAGINGVRRIQAWINIRTHANRMGLGLAFLTTSILTLMDESLVMRTWVARILLVGVLAGYTVSSILDWLDERRQVRILLRESRAPAGGEREAHA